MSTATIIQAALPEKGARNANRPGIPERFSTVLVHPVEALQKYREYSLGVAELESCSDHVLADLGIDRREIRRLVREATCQ